MEAIEFTKEWKRLCKSYKDCSYCPVFSHDSNCNVIQHLEEILPIVTKWSAENPRKTNLDHYAGELERIGYRVNKNYLRDSCPTYRSNRFTSGTCTAHEADCVTCRSWWDEEYVEEGK